MGKKGVQIGRGRPRKEAIAAGIDSGLVDLELEDEEAYRYEVECLAVAAGGAVGKDLLKTEHLRDLNEKQKSGYEKRKARSRLTADDKWAEIVKGLQEQVIDLRRKYEAVNTDGNPRKHRESTSLEFLKETYNNDNVDVESRIAAARAAIPYEYSRKPSVSEVNVNTNIHGIFADVIREVGMSDIPALENHAEDADFEEVKE